MRYRYLGFFFRAHPQPPQKNMTTRAFEVHAGMYTLLLGGWLAWAVIDFVLLLENAGDKGRCGQLWPFMLARASVFALELVHAALVAALHAVERARDAQRDVARAATEMVAKPAPPAPMTLPAAVTIVPLAERNPQALQPTHPEELRVDVEPKPVTTGVQTKTPRAKVKRARKTPPKQDKDLYSVQV